MVPTFGISDWLSSAALSVWISGRATRMKSATSAELEPVPDPDLGRRRVAEHVDQPAGVPDQPDLEHARPRGPRATVQAMTRRAGRRYSRRNGQSRSGGVSRLGIGRIGVDERLEVAEHRGNLEAGADEAGRAARSGPITIERGSGLSPSSASSGGRSTQARLSPHGRNSARALSTPSRRSIARAAGAGAASAAGRAGVSPRQAGGRRRSPTGRGIGSRRSASHGAGRATADAAPGAEGARRWFEALRDRDLRRLRGARGRAGRRAVRRRCRPGGSSARRRGARRDGEDGGGGVMAVMRERPGVREGRRQRLDRPRPARRAGAGAA